MTSPYFFVAVFYLLSGLSFLFLAAGFVGIYSAWRRQKGE